MENNNESQIDPKKIENLHKILSVFDTERLTSKDFIGAFKQVIDHVKQTQTLTVQHLQTITKAVNEARTGLADGNSSQLSALRDELASTISQKHTELTASHQEALSRLNETIASVKDGNDADEDVIVEKVLAKIPPAAPQPIGEDFRNALEALQGDDRLDKNAIRGMDDLEKKVNSHTNVIGNNPGVQLDAGSGIIGRFQTLKFPGATITTSNVDASITVSGGGGTGTVTSASIVSANGFSGSVATPTTTPVITLSTTVTGLLKANGTAISAAVSNTDYQVPISLTTTGTSGAATFNGTTLNIPQYSAGGGSGITRSVNVISTNTTSAAAASTDYVYLVSGTTTLTLPTAVGNSNLYTVKNTGSGTVTVATTSAQTIDGGSTAVLTASLQGSIDLISDGSNWNVV